MRRLSMSASLTANSCRGYCRIRGCDQRFADDVYDRLWERLIEYVNERASGPVGDGHEGLPSRRRTTRRRSVGDATTS